jgi:quinol-cytochrome oxidoreductase complex cytochrome b subunit
MAVDYREQYTPGQLEPFWPNEILRMLVVVLCTLALIMALVVLPVILEYFGLGELLEEATPADPRATPPHIRPEWYFLAVYQYLKLPPQEFLGISGKTIGVLSQGPFVLALLLLPLWAARWAKRRAGWLHTFLVTLIVFNFLALTFWAMWPPPLLFTLFFVAGLVLFYCLVIHEHRTIRRVLGGQEGNAR